MQTFDGIISDRGSKYSVSGGVCHSPDDAQAFIKSLCRKKKFARATHNSWAYLDNGGPTKNDDGESGAGVTRCAPGCTHRRRGHDHRSSVGDGKTTRSYRRGHSLVWRQAPWRRSFPTCSGCGATLSRKSLKVIRALDSGAAVRPLPSVRYPLGLQGTTHFPDP